MNIANISNPYLTTGISAGGVDAMSGASGYVPAADDPLAAARSGVQQGSQDFKDLRTALNGSSLADAQQAFGALSQAIQNASSAAGQSLFAPNSAIGKDFQAIGKALQSGDLSGAKQAFQAFQHDIRTAHRMRSQDAGNDGDRDDGASLNQTTLSAPALPAGASQGLNMTA
jgi:hypothetical protein